MKIISPKYIFGIAFLFLSLGSLKAFSNEIPSLYIAEKFVSFSARLEKSELVLNWKVSPGDVNKGFEIQKSLDGKLFEKIGYLKENEISIMQTDYSFVDKELPPFHTIYYRIKLLDNDSLVNYSRIISISGQELGILTIFPNPGDGVFSLSMGNTKSFELKIMDSKGQHIPILITNIKDSNDVIVHPQNALQSGFYQLKVISGDHMKLEMMKVVVE